MESGSIAKLTRPKLSGISPRGRLFRLLDKGRANPVIWISAPAGSGKTTLVASWLDARKLPCLWYQVDAGDGDIASFFYYMGLAAKKAAPRHKKPLPLLTPEYLQGVPVFTRRYFENLFNRLSGSNRSNRFAIVFDNYQDAHPESGFHEMVAHALDVIPEKVNIVVISRREPPAELSRLKANNKIKILGWDELRFTFEESSELMSSQGKRLTEEARQQLYEKTEGWAAGLVLMMESAGRGGFQKDTLPNTQREVFDYFASEIFEKSDKVLQDVLLKTAFLPKIDPAVAERLTGIETAGQILENLSRYNYFTQRYVKAYQYHPLFREFLLARARSTFSRAALSVLQRNAAELLTDAGYVEEAIELLKDAQAWERLSQLVEARAPKLLAEGRNKTIEAWLRAIPEHSLRQMPWALYWLGACCLPFDQIEARAHYEEAYRRFKEKGNVAGRYLAWAGIAESFIYMWDDFSGMKPWLSELELLQQEHPRFPSAQVEARVILGAFSTLYYTDSNNPMVERWRWRIETLMHESPDPNFKCQAASNLMLYSLWYGDIADQRRIAHYIAGFRDHPAATPFSRILARHALACPEWMSGESERAEALCEEGLRIAEESGVHMLDPFLFAYQVYSRGCWHADTAAMGPLLDRMRASLIPQHRFEAAHYHHLMGWYLSLCNRYDEALIHCHEALVAAKHSAAVSPTAFVYSNIAQILLLAGRPDEAALYLAPAMKIIERHGCVLARYENCFALAALALQRGNKQESVRAVRHTFEWARRLGYWSYTYPHPDILRALCAFALQEGIESDYAVSMIRRSGLPPPADAPAAWPWPVRIFTLGTFRIEKDDEPLVFSGKVQKKPLELLKALIAFGGEDVAEETIAGALWPDADGDTAHRSFETTLYRLRKLIGEKALRLRNGLLTLDPRYCWVDCGEFLNRIKGMEDSSTPEGAQSMEKAFALYQGHFLPADAEAEWSVPQRERLRDKFTRLVVSMGGYREVQGAWEQALGYFQQGLEIDDLAEEFYQHAMTCQIKLGRHAQAASTYRRCKTSLVRALGIAPSPRTEAIINSLAGTRQAASASSREEQPGKKRR